MKSCSNHFAGRVRPFLLLNVPLEWFGATEIAPEYVDVAVKRFRQNFPEMLVTLVATGQTFDEIAAERLEGAA